MWVRSVMMLALAACELEPAPKAKPAPVAPAAAGSDAAKNDVSDACMQVGVHFAQVWIDEAKDDQERASLEQARATMVRRTAVACTRSNWSQDMRDCMNAAKKRADTQACEQKLQPAAPPTPTPTPTAK